MKLSIVAIGRWRECPERSLFQEYIKRIGWDCILKEVETKHSLPSQKQKEKEAELLFDSTPKKAKIIALDEGGLQLSSLEFASLLKQNEDSGNDIAFLIGGAAGHGDLVLKMASKKLSLGKMTWPHMLVRSMLAEQIYRAHTIISGHPYHRGNH